MANSGIYDQELIRYASINQDVRLDAGAVKRLSPALMQPTVNLPIVMAIGGDERDEFKRQNKLLIERWSTYAMQDVPMPGANHFTVVGELAKTEGPLHQAVLKMMGV